MELVELVPKWIEVLKKRRVRVGSQDVMLVGPGARAASQNAGAMRALMVEGLSFESKSDLPAAWLPTRERAEQDAKRKLTDDEWEEFRTRLHGAIGLMFKEGMLS